MPLFGKKNEEPKYDESSAVSDIDEIKKMVAAEPREKMEGQPEEPIEEQPEEPTPVQHEYVEKTESAPVFIKIDRYRNILNALGYLKSSLVMIRNSFLTLNELDKARTETLKLIQKALENMQKKLASLDKELVRPAGLREPMETPEYQDVETVDTTIADLQGQIEQLKSEMEQTY